MTYTQQLKQKQETAHEMELALDTFHNMLEPLEEYVGKVGYYRDWKKRRQIYRKTIADSNDTIEGFEDLFLTQLLIVKASLNRKPEFFRKEVQKEYYKWINAVGIDVNNCPNKLKHLLYEINEVLEGRGERFVQQTRELVKNVKLDPKDALSFFSQVQGPLNKNRERGNFLKGKNWNEIGNEKKLSGNVEDGEEAFKQISQTVSDQDDFNFYQGDYYTNQSDYERRTAIESIKKHIDEWKIKEVAAFVYYISGKEERATILIHESAEENYSNRYWGRELRFQPGKIYRKKDLRSGEWREIEDALNNSSGVRANDLQESNPMEGVENSNSRTGTSSRTPQNNPQQLTNLQIIQDVKGNPRNWRIDEIITEYDNLGKATKKEKALIHKSAEVGHDGEVFGDQPVYLARRFSKEEKAEIEKALNISQTSTSQEIRNELVDDIKRNKFIEVTVLNERTNESKKVIWVISKSFEVKRDERGYLIFDPKNMREVSDLNEAEKEAIGYKSEQVQTNVSTISKNNDKTIGAAGILAIIGVVSVLLIGSVIVRKKLNKKIKKW